MRNRIKNIFDKVEKTIDAIIIKNSVHPHIDENFFYITGLDKGIFEQTIAILYPDGGADILVSELEAESAKKTDVHIHVYKNKEDQNNIFKKLTTSFKNIGINFDGIVYQDFYQLKKILPDSKFIDVSHAFTESRIIKDECEIENIRKSCKIADAVMEKIPDILHEGIHEYEVAAEIDYIMQRNGAEKPAFETISSFASNTAEPHYTHGDGKLKKGDFALFDFGASFKRYNSDITRTFTFGKAEKRQREMHKTVFEAQKVGFDLIAPGIIAKEVHNAVNSYIDNTKFKGRFIHSTGHSLGLAVHDGPGFTPDSNIELKENMVLTVEPGIYLPDFGGVRIEDDILIKKKGLELLTKSSRELIEI